jgi:hypothetical protein
MKAIIINESKICFEAFSDDTNVAMLPERIDVGTDYIIACLNSETATLVEDVTLPLDYFAGKYKYDPEKAEPWSVDENWVEPPEE